MNHNAKTIELLPFIQDLYDNLWLKQKFSKPETEKKIFKEYYERPNITAHQYENRQKKLKYIGNAVRVSHLLLREYFRTFLPFTFSQEEFKSDVKLLWSHWLRNRTNIFVKVIDTLAIIAEAFLFCDFKNTFYLDLKEAPEWFLEWFNEKLSTEFYKEGGLKSLEIKAIACYSAMHGCIESCLNRRNCIILKYEESIYEDSYLLLSLQTSQITFPVPSSIIGVSKIYNLRKIVYIRMGDEIKEVKANHQRLIKNNINKQNVCQKTTVNSLNQNTSKKDKGGFTVGKETKRKRIAKEILRNILNYENFNADPKTSTKHGSQLDSYGKTEKQANSLDELHMLIPLEQILSLSDLKTFVADVCNLSTEMFIEKYETADTKFILSLGGLTNNNCTDNEVSDKQKETIPITSNNTLALNTVHTNSVNSKEPFISGVSTIKSSRNNNLISKNNIDVSSNAELDSGGCNNFIEHSLEENTKNSEILLRCLTPTYNFPRAFHPKQSEYVKSFSRSNTIENIIKISSLSEANLKNLLVHDSSSCYIISKRSSNNLGNLMHCIHKNSSKLLKIVNNKGNFQNELDFERKIAKSKTILTILRCEFSYYFIGHELKLTELETHFKNNMNKQKCISHL